MMKATDTEEVIMKQCQKMLAEVVPGHNMQGLPLPALPELVIKQKGTQVVDIKITLTFTFDTESMPPGEDYVPGA